jgi:hypothetical protein
LTSATPWPRLLTLIGMLVVMFMIMNRAKDPRTWQWLTNESADQWQEAGTGKDAGGLAAVDQRQEIEAADGSESTEPRGFTDLDPEEIEAAREEFQAVSDRAPMLKEEMPSYWRLLKWARQQSIEDLQRRASRSVAFTDFVEAPDQNRGKLVHLRLHVMRSHSYDTPDSPIGVKRLYEAWGWTDEAYPWLYVVVFPERPPGMPIGSDARAEISFEGYFLKLMSYEPHQSPGKPLFAPLLLGRVVWHPVQASGGSNPTWFWITCVAGGVVLLMAVTRWIFFTRTGSAITAVPAERQGESAENWLREVESNEHRADSEPDQSAS